MNIRISKKKPLSTESSATIYGQAWHTVLNDTFSTSLGLFHPQSGDPEKSAIWSDEVTVDGEAFDLRVALSTNSDQNDFADFLDVFEEAFIWGELSFVMIFDDEGRPLLRYTAEEGYGGVDPCDENALPDFVSTSTGRLRGGRADGILSGSGA